MRVGDYVRNQYGIAKVIDIENNYGIDTLVLDNNICFMVDYRTGEINKNIPFFNKLPLTKNIDLNKVKTSPYIIDLIEVGDYVNGLKVSSVGGTYHGRKEKAIYCDYCENKETGKWTMIYDDEIKSIVTKEQFSQMEYKVGE